MSQNACIVCSTTKGKRICLINSEELICPKCCAQIRNEECHGCRYYIQAEQYSLKKRSFEPSDILMRIDPEVDEAVDQALELVEKGHIAVGEKMLSELLEHASDIYTVQFGLGVVRALQRRHDEAISYFDKSLDIFPYYIEGWYNKAISHKEKLEISNMIRSFQKVVELGDPHDEPVVQSKSLLRDFEKHVREDYNVTLAQYLSAEELFNQGFAEMENKAWERASSYFLKSISINPNHPQSYGNLGLCYGFLGKKADALTALDKALELDPYYEPAALNRYNISRLDEGGKLSQQEFNSIEYYREYPRGKRSLLRELLQKGK